LLIALAIMRPLFSFVICLFLLFACANSEFSTYMPIDDFEQPTNVLRVAIPASGELPVTNTVSTQHNDILGGERDLSVVAEGGTPATIITAEVSNGAWISSSPGAASGFSSLQYDGTDRSNSIDHGGLSCIDITGNGVADGFLIQAQATFATDFKFTVYGYNGGVATIGEQVTTNEQTYYYIPFNTFHGDVDFTCVGAIEVTAAIPANSHFVVNTLVLGTYIPDAPSSTETPSNTPRPSASPTPVASALPTPSNSNSPKLPSVTASPAPEPSPSASPIVYECEYDLDCIDPYEDDMNPCIELLCVKNECIEQPSNDSGCCTVDSDCPEIETFAPGCSEAHCVNFTCEYSEVTECPDSPTDISSTGGSGWIIGVVLGCVGGVGILICIVLVIVAIVMKRKSNVNSTSVYDAMIGDM